MSSRPPLASLALPFAVLLFAALPATALSYPAPPAKIQDPAVSTAPSPPTTTTADTNAAQAKKVWTNENLNEAHATVSVVGDNRSQKSLGTPSKPGGSATGAGVRPVLQKLQAQ